VSPSLPPLDGRDRRTSARFVCDIETLCEPGPTTAAAPFSVSVEDLSGGGLRLLASQPIDPGTILRVQWPGASPGSAYDIPVCVVRATGPINGVWTLGCTFLAEIDETDLERLGGRREGSIPPDQRRWMRFPCDHAAHCGLVTSEPQEFLTARVTDVSAIGLGLELPRALEPGSVLTVQLLVYGMGFLVCVARIRQQATGWRAGCLFIRKLNPTELQTST
jgi:hypothetical protein